MSEETNTVDEEVTSVDSFKIRVEVECRKRGLSMTEAARRTGRTPQAFHDILRRGNPTMKTLSEIADAIGCEMEELLRNVTAEEYGRAHLFRS